MDAEATRDAIASLCGLGLVRFTPERRPKVSLEGLEVWLRRRLV